MPEITTLLVQLKVFFLLSTNVSTCPVIEPTKKPINSAVVSYPKIEKLPTGIPLKGSASTPPAYLSWVSTSVSISCEPPQMKLNSVNTTICLTFSLALILSTSFCKPLGSFAFFFAGFSCSCDSSVCAVCAISICSCRSSIVSAISSVATVLFSSIILFLTVIC